MRNKSAFLFQEVQNTICSEIEKLESNTSFKEDLWQKKDTIQGGGITRVLTTGKIFEKAGVNFSRVSGILPEDMSFKLTGINQELPYTATGISLVIHPFSPMIPTTHANFRYLEVADFSWFGGGADLTPYYLLTEDAGHFHKTIKKVCDRHDPAYYPIFKKECDQYFYLPHRQETRGIGGIFFDYLGKDNAADLEKIFSFVEDLAKNWCSFYLPIVIRTKGLAWSEEQKKFQTLRRGRYAEFNLIYDRGTLFGLKTGGRTESILMSLPPVVHWDYSYQPKIDSPEAKLLEVLQNPKDWIN